jgi:hypothetical protein
MRTKPLIPLDFLSHFREPLNLVLQIQLTIIEKRGYIQTGRGARTPQGFPVSLGFAIPVTFSYHYLAFALYHYFDFSQL